MANDQLCALLKKSGQPVPLCPLRNSRVPYEPKVKVDCCYIVCGLLFDDQGRVLMMREAKASCYGQWYLPAGRMEQDETIVDAVRREVLEETGLEMDPTTLILVEALQLTWYRFTMMGTVTGGTLKTLADKDSESMEARWVPWDEVGNDPALPLRCPDILDLIRLGNEHRTAGPSACQLMPVVVPHKTMNIVLAIVHPPNHIIYDNCAEQHFPRKELTLVQSPRRIAKTVAAQLHRLALELLDTSENKLKCVGVLSVEHSGKPALANDGLCLTVLMTTDASLPCPPLRKGVECSWCELTEDVATMLFETQLPKLCT